MKNVIVAFLFSAVVFPAFAGTGNTGSVGKPSREQINKKALEIVLSKSNQLTVTGDVDGTDIKLSDVLARELVTSSETSSKISNSCEFDRSDRVFKCELSILNRDDSGDTESSVQFRYELEKAANGYPSEKLLVLSVEVFRAG